MITKEEIKKAFGQSTIEDSALTEHVISEINRGGNYNCSNPLCNHKWISNKVEIRCPKCNSKLVSLHLKKSTKYKKAEINSLATFDHEDM